MIFLIKIFSSNLCVDTKMLRTLYCISLVFLQLMEVDYIGLVCVYTLWSACVVLMCFNCLLF